MRARSSVVAVLVAGLVLAAGCTVPSGSVPEVRTAKVEVPALPLPAATSWTVSPDALDAVACVECERPDPDTARFFYGRLPLGTVDALADGAWADGTPVDLRAALGNLVVSGYFGGIYLRANLASIGADPAAAESPVAGLLDAVGRLSAQGFDGVAAELVRVAEVGSDDEVRSASATWSTLLAAIHGYNRGYLEVTLERPPPGVTVPTDALVCGSTFDCRTPALPLAALDGLGDVVAAVESPPDLRWTLGGGLLRSVASGSVGGGRAVWEGLLSTADFAPDAYRAIVELSGGFLEVTQAALLATAAAAHGDDLARGRAGLRSTAALVLWAGSYFSGLASPLPDTAQPTLSCPPAA